jgi:hypothetical protein
MGSAPMHLLPLSRLQMRLRSKQIVGATRWVAQVFAEEQWHRRLACEREQREIL